MSNETHTAPAEERRIVLGYTVIEVTDPGQEGEPLPDAVMLQRVVDGLKELP
jgi:hypothetical protein